MTLTIIDYTTVYNIYFVGVKWDILSSCQERDFPAKTLDFCSDYKRYTVVNKTTGTSKIHRYRLRSLAMDDSPTGHMGNEMTQPCLRGQQPKNLVNARKREPANSNHHPSRKVIPSSEL